MKRNKTTKMTAVLLCAAMLLMALVSGCGGGAPSDVESAKEALLGTWYKKLGEDEGEEKWSNAEYTFYENGTMCEKDNQETQYTWELLESEESGKYTLMLEEKKAFSSHEQYVHEIQFEGNEHFSIISDSSAALYGTEYYKNKG